MLGRRIPEKKKLVLMVLSMAKGGLDVRNNSGIACAEHTYRLQTLQRKKSGADTARHCKKVDGV